MSLSTLLDLEPISRGAPPSLEPRGALGLLDLEPVSHGSNHQAEPPPNVVQPAIGNSSISSPPSHVKHADQPPHLPLLNPEPTSDGAGHGLLDLEPVSRGIGDTLPYVISRSIESQQLSVERSAGSSAREPQLRSTALIDVGQLMDLEPISRGSEPLLQAGSPLMDLEPVSRSPNSMHTAGLQTLMGLESGALHGKGASMIEDTIMDLEPVSRGADAGQSQVVKAQWLMDLEPVSRGFNPMQTMGGGLFLDLASVHGARDLAETPAKHIKPTIVKHGDVPRLVPRMDLEMTDQAMPQQQQGPQPDQQQQVQQQQAQQTQQQQQQKLNAAAFPLPQQTQQQQQSKQQPQQVTTITAREQQSAQQQHQQAQKQQQQQQQNQPQQHQQPPAGPQAGPDISRFPYPRQLDALAYQKLDTRGLKGESDTPIEDAWVRRDYVAGHHPDVHDPAVVESTQNPMQAIGDGLSWAWRSHPNYFPDWQGVAWQSSQMMLFPFTNSFV